MGSHHLWWLHWWYAFIFLGCSVLVTVRARYFLNVRSAWCGLRVAAGDGSSDDQRIEAAVLRRQRAEGPPAPVGLYVGCLSFMAAIAAALNVVDPALLYAGLCFSTALIAGLVFQRLRNSQPTRVAVLAVRRSESVIPTYFFAGSALCALLVLSFASDPNSAVSATLVCISALMTTYIAWRMTQLPAMLSGEDIPAEQLVDDRLRFHRSTACMVFAVVQTFVFSSQFRNPSDEQIAVFVLSFALWVGFAVWFMVRRWRPVRLA